MRLIESSSESLSGSYIFFDNNVLGFISHNPELFEEIIKKTEGATRCLDPLTKFEFLRDSRDLKQKLNKHDLLSTGLFIDLENHPDTFKKINENALGLSEIISFLREKNKKTKKGKESMSVPDLVDLFLGARLMIYSANAYILTLNKSDFPSPIFLIDRVYQYESDNEGSIKTLALVKFNSTKFAELAEEFNKQVAASGK